MDLLSQLGMLGYTAKEKDKLAMRPLIESKPRIAFCSKEQGAMSADLSHSRFCVLYPACVPSPFSPPLVVTMEHTDHSALLVCGCVFAFIVACLFIVVSYLSLSLSLCLFR